jgi:phosphomannomutase
VFALDLAATLEQAGVLVESFDQEVPTPLLAHAVLARGAHAGVMVTASHNPASDNGLKVYDHDGAQLIPPHDADIARRMAALPLEPVTAPDPTASAASAGPAADQVLEVPTTGVRMMRGPRSGGPVVRSYLERAASIGPRRVAAPLTVARTSLHGVGGELCARALSAIDGLTVVVVDEQETPDPDFPTVADPNPEHAATLSAVIELAERSGADLAIALDPDADRLAVALPGRSSEEPWQALRGDQVGALLAAHLLSTTTGTDRLFTTTVVSSRLVPAMCRAAGVHHVETLTGFKWLCRPGIEHPEWRQLLAYEEALGYAVGPGARDKDGITAAVATIDAVSRWAAAGRTSWDVLDDLAARHGLHVQRNGSVRPDRPGSGPTAALVRAARRLVAQPPSTVAGRRIEHTDRPAPDVARWYLDDDTRIVVRPSGTEPKVKYYLETIRSAEGGADADQTLAMVEAELIDRLRAPR